MPFMIDANDKPGSDAARQKVRPEHMAFLAANVGRLLAAGAKLADDGVTALGSFYILDTDDRATAEAFINSDPFMKQGVFAGFTATRWRKGFFNFAKM